MFYTLRLPRTLPGCPHFNHGMEYMVQAQVPHLDNRSDTRPSIQCYCKSLHHVLAYVPSRDKFPAVNSRLRGIRSLNVQFFGYNICLTEAGLVGLLKRNSV